MTNIKRIGWFITGIFLGGMIVVAMDAAYAAPPAPVKIDCKNAKNAKKIECAKPPTSKVEDKAKVKKPIKVRKADKSVQKKAEEKVGKK